MDINKLSIEDLHATKLMELSEKSLNRIIRSVPGVLTDCGIHMGYKYKEGQRWVAGQSFKRAMLKGSLLHYECLSAFLKKHLLKTNEQIKSFQNVWKSEIEKPDAAKFGLVR